MSAKKYPRIVTRKCGKGKPCVVCGVRTGDTAEIQVSWFRGEDEVVPACREHPVNQILDTWTLEQEPPATTKQDEPA